MQESIQLVIDSLPFLLKGAGYTLQLSIGGMFFGLLLGFILALMRLSPIWPVRWLARFYISIFRGTGAVPSSAVDYLAHAGGVHHVPGGFAHLLDHGDCVIDVAEPF